MKINRDLDISISPKELAEAFWDMDADKQARFFTHLFDISGKELLEKQMVAVYMSNEFQYETSKCIDIIRNSTLEPVK